MKEKLTKKQAAEQGVGCNGMLTPGQGGAGISQDLPQPTVLLGGSWRRAVFVRSREREQLGCKASHLAVVGWPG